MHFSFTKIFLVIGNMICEALLLIVPILIIFTLLKYIRPNRSSQQLEVFFLIALLLSTPRDV